MCPWHLVSRFFLCQLLGIFLNKGGAVVNSTQLLPSHGFVVGRRSCALQCENSNAMIDSGRAPRLTNQYQLPE
ncbi:hypothetical protein HD554DRAFT_2139115 [Boletus coccyginus]|nr:hypothetical protein HD554DRAFT_2139115 [Boletus coccyginus]